LAFFILCLRVALATSWATATLLEAVSVQVGGGEDRVPGPTNIACTVWSALIVTVQVPVPEQPPPDQPTNEFPDVGVAVNVTCVPLGKLCEQLLGHEIPAGLLVTVPVPDAPLAITVRVCGGGLAVNVAVTDWSELIVTMQVDVPVQPPPFQPVKVDPDVGVAVRVTGEPAVNWCEQVPGQLIADGLLVTVPEPVPASVTLSVYS
jgi:hypothetical protein